MQRNVHGQAVIGGAQVVCDSLPRFAHVCLILIKSLQLSEVALLLIENKQSDYYDSSCVRKTSLRLSDKELKFLRML